MSLVEDLFPASFPELASWSGWVQADEIARRQQCVNASMQEIRAFYDCMLASMDRILEHLNRFPLDDLPVAEQNLLSLVLAFVEAAISVEMFEQPEISYGLPIERFRPLHHLVP